MYVQNCICILAGMQVLWLRRRGWVQLTMTIYRSSQRQRQGPSSARCISRGRIGWPTDGGYPSFTYTARGVREAHARFCGHSHGKASSTLVLVCRHHYHSNLASDLTSMQFYTRATTAQLQAALATAQQCLAPTGVQLSLDSRPTYHACTVKMHKQPPQMRYLACSQSAPTAHLADLVTATMQLVQEGFLDLWMALPLGSGDAWLCQDTGAAVRMLQRLNAAAVPMPTSMAHILAAYDSTRLYTSIAHGGLIQGLEQRVRKVMWLVNAKAAVVTDRPPPPAAPGAIRSKG